MNRFDELAKEVSRGRVLKLVGLGVLALFTPGVAEAKKKRRKKRRSAASICLPEDARCDNSSLPCCIGSLSPPTLDVCRNINYCRPSEKRCVTPTWTPGPPEEEIPVTCNTPTCTPCTEHWRELCSCVPLVESGEAACLRATPGEYYDPPGTLPHLFPCTTDEDCALPAPESRCADFSSCSGRPFLEGLPPSGKVCADVCKDCS